MTSRSKKVSIVVPIYNVDKYLQRCLDSIANQSYSDTEIILVNDGSTDTCAVICEKFKASHPEIVYINK